MLANYLSPESDVSDWRDKMHINDIGMWHGIVHNGYSSYIILNMCYASLQFLNVMGGGGGPSWRDKARDSSALVCYATMVSRRYASYATASTHASYSGGQRKACLAPKLSLF